MGGTPHGIANILACPNGRSGQARCRDVFAAINSFFEHLCTPAGGNYFTEIAGYWGTGASGYDATGGANPAGENAFRVFRQNTSAARPGGGSQLGALYWYIQWADSEAFNGTLFYNVASYDGVGIHVAFLEDGGDPWAAAGGTELNNGADVKALPLWAAGTSTLHVMEYSSNNGSHSTNKNNLMPCFYDASALSTPVYGQMIADADNVIILLSSQYNVAGGENEYVPGIIHGLIDPLAGISSYSYPVFTGCYFGNAAGPGYQFFLGYPSNRDVRTLSSIWGTSGGNAIPMGAVVRSTNSTTTWRWYDLEGVINSYQPNVYTGSKFDESPIYITTSTDWAGWVDSFYRSTYGVGNNNYDPTNQRAVFGYHTDPCVKLSVPWPTAIGEPPGATWTAAGVTF